MLYLRFPQLHYVVFMSTFQPKQSELGIVNGVPLPEMPEDLFIPPQALEICLETFTGPMDLLLYLIKKQNINILDLKYLKLPINT